MYQWVLWDIMAIPLCTRALPQLRHGFLDLVKVGVRQTRVALQIRQARNEG